MIEEVISEILAAEQTAEKIKTEAEEKSSALALDAEKRAQDVKNATAAKVKARKILRQAAAEKAAEEAYLSIVAQSKLEAERLTEESGEKINAAGEKIYRRIIDGDC